MRINLLIASIVISLLWNSKRYAQDYIIYNVVQNIPMGTPNEIIKKNYYINMGQQQGLSKGTILNVHRIIGRLAPHKTEKRYHYKIKVGELEIIHTENEVSIAQIKALNIGKDTPLLEIQSMIIGDHVSVKTN